MKNILINPYSHDQEWCKEYFPDRSLGMMPVGGRCAAEYFIDLALRCEVGSLLLLGPTYNEHLAEHLYEYQHGELKLDYRKGGGNYSVRNLLDIYKEFGTDSYIGRIASISMSCTETIFYTMSVYFVTAKVTKTRYTLAGALLATGAGLVASVILAGVM